MDGYPAGSLDHNVPLIVVLGLNSEAAELPLPAELKGQGIFLQSGTGGTSASGPALGALATA